MSNLSQLLRLKGFGSPASKPQFSLFLWIPSNLIRRIILTTISRLILVDSSLLSWSFLTLSYRHLTNTSNWKLSWYLSLLSVLTQAVMPVKPKRPTHDLLKSHWFIHHTWDLSCFKTWSPDSTDIILLWSSCWELKRTFCPCYFHSFSATCLRCLYNVT